MAKLVLHQVEDRDTLLEDAARLYCDALAVRPVGHPDRPSTLIQLAAVHVARSQKQRDYVEDTEAERLLDEALGLGSPDSHTNQVAGFMRQLHDGRKVGLQSDGQSSVEQHVTPRVTIVDLDTSSIRLLEHYKRFGDLADLQQAIVILKELVRSISIWDAGYPQALCNLAAASWHRFNHLGELADLEDAISRQRDVVDLTPHGHPHKPGYLNNLGNSFFTRFQRLGQLTDLEDTISRQSGAVDLTPHGHPDKPRCLDSIGISLMNRFERLG